MVYQPTSRVLTVLELLQTHGQMKGQELASRLEVDARTVRRYVTTLQDMGIPIEPEFGRYGGYALRPGFKLPPLMFTDDEVLVLTLGLLMARRAGVTEANAAVESALAKVERVLPFNLRERLRALQDAMLTDEDAQTTVSSDTLTGLSIASQQKRQVHLRYITPKDATERVFDPYAVIRYAEQWYAVGYCHLREGLRTFRLDRVEGVMLLETTFTPPADFDALEYMLASFEAIPDRWDIDVLLSMPLEQARRRIPRTLATLVQEGKRVRLRASMPDLDEMARMFIALGCPMTILNPPELRDTFLKIADEIRAAHTPPEGNAVPAPASLTFPESPGEQSR
jgi:predicted DNA-binding transcriptional regulator YafY